MDWDMAVIEDDDDIVFKVKRSAIAEALRSNALVPIPATDANIDVAVNQLFSKIKEVSLPIIDDYYFDLGMDYFYNGRSLYKRIYELFECNVNFDGFCLCLGFSWVSKDESILYLAITNATNGLTVLHLSFAALKQVVKHEEDNVFWIDGAVRDFHVDDAYAESDRVLEFAQISPAAADFFSEHPVCSKNGIIDLSDVMNWTNFKADGRELAALRELSDEELAAEIEKAGASMMDLVDVHMSHVHGLGGTEKDSTAYYAARKRHADLQFESGRRLHASLNRGKRESGHSPQAMAAAASKAALECGGGAVEHGGNKHQ